MWKLFSVFFAPVCAAAAAPAFYAFGTGSITAYNGMSLVKEWALGDNYTNSMVTWAALYRSNVVTATVENENKLLVIDMSSGVPSLTKDVDLTGPGNNVQLITPVAVMFHESSNKLYCAMFGDGNSMQGVAEVDATFFQVTVHLYLPNTPGHHVHNIHSFDIDGKQELFINDIGNPWSSPPGKGYGMVHFNPVTGVFDTATIVNLPTDGMHARASAQDINDPSVIYVLTQQPLGAPSKLFVLKRTTGTNFQITQEIDLPTRMPNPGEGGADVISLGGQRVLITDRGVGNVGGSSMMYLYDLSNPAKSHIPTRQWVMGLNARYTGVVNGSIISANNHPATEKSVLTVWPNLLTSVLGKYEIADSSNWQTFDLPATIAASFVLQAAA